jgi:hypothetical protein
MLDRRLAICERPPGVYDPDSPLPVTMGGLTEPCAPTR